MTMPLNASERKSKKSEFQQPELISVEESFFPWWRGAVVGILISLLMVLALWLYSQWLYSPIHQNPSPRASSKTGGKTEIPVTIYREDASLKTQSGFVYPVGFDIGDPLPVGYEGASFSAASVEKQQEIKKLLEQTGEELPAEYISE